MTAKQIETNLTNLETSELDLKKILIVDDHPMVLEGLKSLLSDSEEIVVAGTVSNAIDAIAFLKNNEVDIAFLDINLPDINGIELCKKIKEQFPAADRQILKDIIVKPPPIICFKGDLYDVKYLKEFYGIKKLNVVKE